MLFTALFLIILIMLFQNKIKWAAERFTFDIILCLSIGSVFFFISLFSIIKNREKMFLLSLFFYQICTSYVYVIISKTTMFSLVFYRIFSILPQSIFTQFLNGILIITVINLPIIFTVLKKEKPKTLYSALIISLFFSSFSGFFGNSSWLKISYDLNSDFSCIKIKYDSYSSRDSLAIAVLDWAHNSIQYEAGKGPVRINELIKNGKGTCGFQTKAAGTALKYYHFPVRYVTLHSKGWKSYHSVLEVYLNGSWAFFDTQHNKYFYENGHYLNSFELSERPKLLESAGYKPELFSNILLFTDGDYFKITPDIKDLFY